MHRNHALPIDASVDLSTVDATVLVVDDDEDLADTYALWLREVVDVHTAYSGAAALDLLESADVAVDVVLLDRRMPSMSGDAVLAELRDRGHDPRVTMVTAVEPTRAVVEMPFDDYLVKPVGREALLSTVEDLLALDEHAAAFREYFELEAKLATLSASAAYREDDEPEELADLRERVAAQRERALLALDEDGEEFCEEFAGDNGLTDTG